MANSHATLSPGILSKQVLASLKLKFPSLFKFCTDFRNEGAKYNETITAQFSVNPTVSDYSTVNGYVAQDTSTLEAPVVMNKFKHVTFGFNDVERSSTGRNFVQENVEGAAYALGRQALNDFGALINTTNFPTVSHETVRTVANTDRPSLSAIRKKLVGRGIDPAGLNGLVNMDVFEELSNDTGILSRDVRGPGANYKQGAINDVNGFNQLFEWPEMPSGENLTGFFGEKRAMGMVFDVPSDPREMIKDLPIGGKIGIETDEETGLSIMYRYRYDIDLGVLKVTWCWMYGIAILDAAAGERLVHTAN